MGNIQGPIIKARHWKTGVPQLYGVRLINYRAILTPCKSVNDLVSGERLGRKFTCAPFIPHDRGLTTLDSNVPHKTTRSRVTNPWMNKKTTRLTRQKNRAFIKAKSSKNTRDTRRYKKLKTACQRSIREAHDTYVHDVIGQSAQENPKKFWSYIKGEKQESSGVSPLRNVDGVIRNVDGVIHSEANVKANILNRQFVSVFTKEDTASIPDKSPSPYASMEGTVKSLYFAGAQFSLFSWIPSTTTSPTNNDV